MIALLGIINISIPALTIAAYPSSSWVKFIKVRGISKVFMNSISLKSERVNPLNPMSYLSSPKIYCPLIALGIQLMALYEAITTPTLDFTLPVKPLVLWLM